VQPHPSFQREGDDLFVEAPVPYPVMALGGALQIDTPGGTIDVNVSAGSPSGTVLTYRQKGMPNVAGRGRGALHVRLVVAVPRKLSKEQKKLVDQLGKTMPIEKVEPTSADSADDKPFFSKVRDLFG
jgi:molecular chaperone DnaJ